MLRMPTQYEKEKEIMRLASQILHIVATNAEDNFKEFWLEEEQKINEDAITFVLREIRRPISTP